MPVVGSVVDRIPGPKYSAKLSFAEFAPRLPLPRIPTLRRQRHELPEGFRLSLRAPRGCVVSERGPLRFDAELERSWQWLLNARDALAAAFVILPTPADFTPGQRDRDLLEALSARLPRAPEQHWVWEPNGPWEAQDAAQFAARLGLVLAFDPLLDPFPEGEVAYARLRALGERKNFSDSTLEDVGARLDACGASHSVVVIDAPRSFDYAVRMRQLLAGNAPPELPAALDDEDED